jgi:hypothetical protein
MIFIRNTAHVTDLVDIQREAGNCHWLIEPTLSMFDSSDGRGGWFCRIRRGKPRRCSFTVSEKWEPVCAKLNMRLISS